MKKLLNIALTMPIKDEGQAGKVKVLEELGSLKDIGSTKSTALIDRIMQGAVSGDPRMLEMALDLSGALERAPRVCGGDPGNLIPASGETLLCLQYWPLWAVFLLPSLHLWRRLFHIRIFFFYQSGKFIITSSFLGIFNIGRISVNSCVLAI